jgi:hypothetical protein
LGKPFLQAKIRFEMGLFTEILRTSNQTDLITQSIAKVLNLREKRAAYPKGTLCGLRSAHQHDKFCQELIGLRCE